MSECDPWLPTGMWDLAGHLNVGDVVRLETTLDHSRCHASCVTAIKCPNTGSATWVDATRGRWDAEAGRTALPYEPVWVRLGCGCKFGDERLAEPMTEAEA